MLHLQKVRFFQIQTHLFAKSACEIWSTVNRLFEVSTGAKISRVKHDLHSIKKGELTVREYVAKIENVCALLAASGSTMSEAEKVEVVLAGLSVDFDIVLTLASFLMETLPFQRLVDVLLEFESRQLQVAREVPMQAHLVEQPLVAAVVDSGSSRDVHEGRSHGLGFRLRVQCQICSRFGHLAQCCFYRFNRTYGGPNASNTVRASSSAYGGRKLQGGVYGDSGSGENLLGGFQNQIGRAHV